MHIVQAKIYNNPRNINHMHTNTAMKEFCPMYAT